MFYIKSCEVIFIIPDRVSTGTVKVTSHLLIQNIFNVRISLKTKYQNKPKCMCQPIKIVVGYYSYQRILK